jgi:hydrogenase maturation protein HypF
MLLERLSLLITGQVQGVGFRPYVSRLAQELGLTGWVQNNAFGVVIEIQGQFISRFLEKLTLSPPALARIDDIEIKTIPPCPQESCFQIIPSQPGESRTMMSPDTGICEQCLQDFFSPTSRYYHYPFLNCTQCGPRATITHHLPYDRAQTSMAAFPFCKACEIDYHDPNNRRYHAQPTACKHCGPTLSASVEKIVEAIQAGQIIAIKGLGGYQLVCDAKSEAAIVTLRQRKQREAKPFALMVANGNSLDALVECNDQERQLLMSPARPIVLLKKRGDTLSQWIAPGLSHLGVMLPATPLHYLLFHALAGYPQGLAWLEKPMRPVLIVTSANVSGSPLLIEDDRARQDLVSIADLVVSYNRQIVTRVDDSVMQIRHHSPTFIRRARGFVPERIKLPYAIPSTLALGADLKNTFCITRDDEAFVSQHIGSLTNPLTIEFLHESLSYWMRLLEVKPERVACDWHPDFYTSLLAHDFNSDPIKVQHHHAHLAAVACEHHLLEPALGLALDGYGYGEYAGSWGGELMVFDAFSYHRMGSLLPLPQPGGDRAARRPWQMAASVLHLLGRNEEIVRRYHEEPLAPQLAELLKFGRDRPSTTSCGRLFDAASALLGIVTQSSYEGEAARKLESLVTELEVMPNGWRVENKQFSLLPTLNRILDADPVKGANLFHGTLIAGLTEWVVSIASQESISVIVLSGGCFLNKVLAEGLFQGLTQQGLRVYLPQRLPPNDGGISLGQAFIAGSKRSGL